MVGVRRLVLTQIIEQNFLERTQTEGNDIVSILDKRVEIKMVQVVNEPIVEMIVRSNHYGMSRNRENFVSIIELGDFVGNGPEIPPSGLFDQKQVQANCP